MTNLPNLGLISLHPLMEGGVSTAQADNIHPQDPGGVGRGKPRAQLT